MDSTHRIEPEAGSLRELLRVAWPLVLSSGSLSFLHVSDRIFLTWYSLDAVAASLPAGLLVWTLMSIAMGTVTYVNTFVAQYDGSGQKNRVSAAVWQGVYLAIGSGLLLAALGPFAGVACGWIGHAEPIQSLEATYLEIGLYGSVPMMLVAALSCFFSGRGENVVPLLINLGMVAFNIGLDYLMIFGHGPFPEMGIAGAAWATQIAKLAAAIVYLILFIRLKSVQPYNFWRNFRFDSPLFGRLLRYGSPTGIQFLLDIAGFSLFILIVGSTGENELTATNLALNLNSLAFVPLMGFGTAVSTIVGRRIGEGRPDLAVRSTWLAIGLACSYTGLFVVLILFAPSMLLSIYEMNANDPNFAEVSAIVVQLLQFVALFSFFDAIAIVFGSALRGAGDTRFCTVVTFICCWSLMVLPTWISHRFYSGSLTISWLACTTYLMVLSLIFVWRFQGGRWKTMRVIEDTPSDHPEADASLKTSIGVSEPLVATVE